MMQKWVGDAWRGKKSMRGDLVNRRIGVVLAMALMTAMGSPVRAEATGEANAILDKAIRALGGEEKLSKVKAASWKGKGTISIMGGDNSFTNQFVVQGIDRLGSTRSLVVLEGVGHDLDPPYPDDVFTWAIVFLDAQLRGNREANAKLQRMTAVAGGGNDRRTSDYTSPLPPVGDERSVVEFHHAGFDHYFVTAEPGEIAGLDAGSPPGWRRTGYTFKVYQQQAAGTNAVCRFLIPPAHGDSHFFSADPAECAQVLAKSATDANFSGYVQESAAFFYIALPDTSSGICPAGTLPVYRLWNQRLDSNHRYPTDATARDTMLARGYVLEGYGAGAYPTSMCSPQ